ncbi:MAG: phosphoenolpyruvate--protein phosphotransferase [Thermoguttaceae bacterium]|nr:phosphoenolpyruvate--protein phosphotransferase [Thermoguttaceae bacterium]MBR6435432.1 phosphoenolpyruvate--protein phosphotransferase [Thermoguttaceae bacterium]
MITLKGIPVSPGIAFGEALVIDNEGFRIRQTFVEPDEVDEEINRYENAFDIAKQELAVNAKTVTQELGETYGLIFQAHHAILDDSTLRRQILEKIQKERCSAAYAISTIFRQYAEKFKNIPDNQLSLRANDILDLETRIMKIVMGVHSESLTAINKDLIVLAHNLTPSETTNMNRNCIRAFITEIGSKASHTAIIAEALEIPAVVGIGRFLDKVQAGQKVIVDGNQGIIYINPTVDVVKQYQKILSRYYELNAKLNNLDNIPCQTKDGTRIRILGNMELEFEAQNCLNRGADGIGLYRTEFLWLTNELQLDEETHFQKYKQVVETMSGKPVTIRTCDLGADKLLTNLMPGEDRNPALGLRSIRLCLSMPEMFRKQLRAILRASAFGPIQILFPMVSTLTEWRRIKMIVNDVFEDLDERGIPFNHNVPLGIMVEVPSTVMMIEEFLQIVDFISIGTNDLIQYTVAVDRTNKDVAKLFNGCEPSVIKLIWKTVTAANKVNKPVSLCGQIASDPALTILLLGLGLRSLSMPPGAMREIKRVCSSLDMLRCREIAFRALRTDNAGDIQSLLQRELAAVLPEKYRLEE